MSMQIRMDENEIEVLTEEPLDDRPSTSNGTPRTSKERCGSDVALRHAPSTSSATSETGSGRRRPGSSSQSVGHVTSSDKLLAVRTAPSKHQRTKRQQSMPAFEVPREALSKYPQKPQMTRHHSLLQARPSTTSSTAPCRSPALLADTRLDVEWTAKNGTSKDVQKGRSDSEAKARKNKAQRIIVIVAVVLFLCCFVLVGITMRFAVTDDEQAPPPNEDMLLGWENDPNIRQILDHDKKGSSSGGGGPSSTNSPVDPSTPNRRPFNTA